MDRFCPICAHAPHVMIKECAGTDCAECRHGDGSGSCVCDHCYNTEHGVFTKFTFSEESKEMCRQAEGEERYQKENMRHIEKLRAAGVLL